MSTDVPLGIAEMDEVCQVEFQSVRRSLAWIWRNVRSAAGNRALNLCHSSIGSVHIAKRGGWVDRNDRAGNKIRRASLLVRRSQGRVRAMLVARLLGAMEGPLPGQQVYVRP